MTIDLLWPRVASLMESATERIILVAPFVKRGVVERLLESTSSEVVIECFTRWDPQEVARGVSDPDILEIPRLDGRVYLCPNLHAKAVIADERALVGSANLTLKALGLAAPPNLEIMLEVPATTQEVVNLLEQLRSSATLANSNLADAVLKAAELFGGEPLTAVTAVRPFYPTSRRPQALEAVYRGSPVDAHIRVDLVADLFRLGLPPSLPSTDFRSEVARILLENPALEPLTAAGSVDNTHMKSVISESLDMDSEDVDRAAETMLLWVSEFCQVHVEASAWRIRQGKEF